MNADFNDLLIDSVGATFKVQMFIFVELCQIEIYDSDKAHFNYEVDCQEKF